MLVVPNFSLPPRTYPLRVVAFVLLICGPIESALQARAGDSSRSGRLQTSLADAQKLFYDARYADAAAQLLALRSSGQDDLAVTELRSSALLFQLKGLLEDRPEKDPIKTCTRCPGLIAEFLDEFRRGQGAAKAQLKATPGNEEALFFLGKIDLNYVWLQLGPLHRKTGWDEYWEARHSLDAVLERNPRHVRARIARAWIDYIVDTRMPWGTKWLLGGGNRKQGLRVVREATQMQADFFTHAEAEFALWNMQMRERDMAGAVVVARRLAQQFPDNREVGAFLESREARAVR
jgi:hypothetical protein